MNQVAGRKGESGIWRTVLFAALVGGVLVRWLLYARTGFTIGDAFIGFRFSEQFAAGHGMVFNVGERVGGNTSVLHTLCLGLGGAMGIDVSVFARFFGIACDVVAFFLMLAMLRRQDGVETGSLRVGIVLTMFLCPILFLYSVSGMETPLYILLILFLFWSSLRDADWVYLVSALLLVFCRPDGVVAIAASLVVRAVSARAIPWLRLAGVIVIGLSYLGFSYICYGVVIPPSVGVKALVFHHTITENLRYIADRFFLHRGFLFLLYVIVMCVVTSVLWRRPVVLVTGVSAVGYLVFAALAPYLRTWYVVPFLALSVFTILVGLAMITENWRMRIPESLIMLVLALYTMGSCYAYRLVFREGRAWRLRTHDLGESSGLWLRENTRPDARVFVTALETGYFSKRYTVDWPGLVCPAVPAMIRSNPQTSLFEMVDRLNVDYAVIPTVLCTNVPSRFRLVKIFTTRSEASHMGLGEESDSLYERMR